jgi:hypothetical protein
MIAAQKATIGLSKGGRPKTGFLENPVSEKPPSFAEAGIDKNLAHRVRKALAQVRVMKKPTLSSRPLSPEDRVFEKPDAQSANAWKIFPSAAA